MSYQLKKAMREEFTAEIGKGYVTIDEIRDNIGEWIDGYLPVYNDRIIDEWRAMPSEYDNRGSAEMGHLEQEVNIVNLMSLDLYIYYSEMANDVLNEMEEGE